MGSNCTMLALPHTPPSERVVLGNRYAHSIPSLVCSLNALEPSIAPSELGGSVHGCRHKRTGKISDSIGENSKSSSGSSPPPLTRCLELCHFPPFLPARALRAANDLLAILGNLFEFRQKYLEVPPARSGVPTTLLRLRCRGRGSSSS